MSRVYQAFADESMKVQVVCSIDSIPRATLRTARDIIYDHNDDLINSGKSMESKYFLLTTDKGQFVAEVLHASGSGRVSADRTGPQYATLRIEFALHRRIVETLFDSGSGAVVSSR